MTQPATKTRRQILAVILGEIETNDLNYEARYGLVFEALGLAVLLGYRAGIKIDPNEPEWPVVYIDLPTGQVSWHMPQYAGEWDNHDTPEKYHRIRSYITDEGQR
jgi:hypothetical protein